MNTQALLEQAWPDPEKRKHAEAVLDAAVEAYPDPLPETMAVRGALRELCDLGLLKRRKLDLKTRKYRYTASDSAMEWARETA